MPSRLIERDGDAVAALDAAVQESLAVRRGVLAGEVDAALRLAGARARTASSGRAGTRRRSPASTGRRSTSPTRRCPLKCSFVPGIAWSIQPSVLRSRCGGQGPWIAPGVEKVDAPARPPEYRVRRPDGPR